MEAFLTRAIVAIALAGGLLALSGMAAEAASLSEQHNLGVNSRESRAHLD